MPHELASSFHFVLAWLDGLRLRSANPQWRCKAVENLSVSNHPGDTERIFASLNDESPQVRCAAVRALGRVKRPDSEKRLIRALQDKSFQVREAAARALGRVGILGSAVPLVACLRDPDAAVRIAAAATLRAIGWKPATREELAWFEIALGNTPSSVSTGPLSAELPVIDPNQDTSFFRRLAAETLKEQNDPARIKLLLATLRGKDLLARISAIHDLGQIHDAYITDELLKLFRDRDPNVRLTAAQVLGVRDDSPPAHFVGLLQDPNVEVRLAAIEFLGRIRHQQIAEVLSPLVADSNLLVRQATASALGLIGDASAIEPLILGLADEDEHMREAAQRALDQIDPRWMQTEAALRARLPLETLLSSRPPSDRWLVEQVLRRLPQPPADLPESLHPQELH